MLTVFTVVRGGLRKSSDELNGKAASPRSKCWPPSYCDPPPLIVTDYGVCRASTPVDHRHQQAVDDRSATEAVVVEPETDETPCERTSPSTATTDDSQRLLTQVEQHVDTVPSVSSSTDGTLPLCEA